MHTRTTDRKTAFLEISLFFLFMLILTVLMRLSELYFPIDGFITGIFCYLILCATLLFYMLHLKKEPLSSIGLKKICPADIPKGLLLGFCMFIVQQIPLLLMKFDYSVYATAPDPGYIFTTTLYCLFCVGFAEELIFRGFILHKTLAACPSKIWAVGLNILLFYLIHWSAMQFTFGEFYNLTLNVIILCVYFFCSRKKSLAPLIIAHGFYDVLTSVLLPVFVYFCGQRAR